MTTIENQSIKKQGRKAKEGSEWVSSYYETFKNSEKACDRYCEVCQKQVAYYSWSNHCRSSKHKMKLVLINHKDIMDNLESIKAEEVKKFIEKTTRKKKESENNDEDSENP
jgi:hypothetical protein